MIDRWSKKIDSITNDFISDFSKLNYQQLNKKPDNKNWSIGQIINHLVITNESYYPIIEAVRKGDFKVPFTGKVGFLVEIIGKFILKTVQPETKRKVKTFSIWEPPLSNISADILKEFDLHQSALKKMIMDCDDLVMSKTIISSPANKNIVYKLETAFDIIVAHEQRHFDQAKRLSIFFNYL